MEFHHIVPQEGDMDGELEGNEDHPTSPDPPIWNEVFFLFLFFLLFLHILHIRTTHSFLILF